MKLIDKDALSMELWGMNVMFLIYSFTMQQKPL